jgi:hypothetical protein
MASAGQDPQFRAPRSASSVAHSGLGQLAAVHDFSDSPRCRVPPESVSSRGGLAAGQGGIVDDRRDEVAGERDRVAETRDRTVDGPEADLDERNRQVDTRAEQLGVPAEGTGAFAQRPEARAGRSHGRQDGEERGQRTIAAADRAEATKPPRSEGASSGAAP